MRLNRIALFSYSSLKRTYEKCGQGMRGVGERRGRGGERGRDGGGRREGVGRERGGVGRERGGVGRGEEKGRG